MQRYLLLFVIVIFILLTHIFIYKSSFTKNIDYAIYDFSKELVKTDITQEKSSHVVIVDIDEKSLNHFGQWPWPRILLSQLISDINA